MKWVEEALAEALTTYQKPTDEDGGYVRQSSRKYFILDFKLQCSFRLLYVKNSLGI